MNIKLFGDATFKQAMLLKNMIKVLGKLQIPYGQGMVIRSNKNLTKILIKETQDKIKSLKENEQDFEKIKDEFISKQFASEIISRNMLAYKDYLKHQYDALDQYTCADGYYND